MRGEHERGAGAPRSSPGDVGRHATSGGLAALSAGIENCPLCGTEFDAAGQGCRPSCPLASGCHVVCCPSCGYSFPQERGLAGRLRRLLGGRQERKGHSK